ncbi:MAG: hypothetical protein ACYCV6_14700 [Steroidobacteraceae bacterium]
MPPLRARTDPGLARAHRALATERKHPSGVVQGRSGWDAAPRWMIRFLGPPAGCARKHERDRPERLG